MFSQSLIQDYLYLSVKRFPEKIALISGEEKWTYSSIYQHINQLAEFLIDALLHTVAIKL